MFIQSILQKYSYFFQYNDNEYIYNEYPKSCIYCTL